MSPYIKTVMLKAGYAAPELAVRATKLTELVITEFIEILVAEITLEQRRKATACNEFDRSWHQGKIDHFTKLVAQTKQHFGVAT